MKTCKYCGETIQDNAVKCKHCGEWLDKGYVVRERIQSIKEWFVKNTHFFRRKSLLWTIYQLTLIIFLVGAIVGIVTYLDESISPNKIFRNCDNRELIYNHERGRYVKDALAEHEIVIFDACMSKSTEEASFIYMGGMILLLVLFLTALHLLKFLFRKGKTLAPNKLDLNIMDKLGRLEYILALGFIYFLGVGIYYFSDKEIGVGTGYIFSSIILVLTYFMLSILRGKDLNISKGTTTFYHLFPGFNTVALPVYLFAKSGSLDSESLYSRKTKWIIILGVLVEFILLGIFLDSIKVLNMPGLIGGYLLIMLGVWMSQRKNSRFDNSVECSKDTSILEQYDSKQIEEAKESLVKSGLCDTLDQAQRNLEMDLEERHQLATGGGKKKRNS